MGQGETNSQGSEGPRKPHNTTDGSLWIPTSPSSPSQAVVEGPQRPHPRPSALTTPTVLHIKERRRTTKAPLTPGMPAVLPLKPKDTLQCSQVLLLLGLTDVCQAPGVHEPSLEFWVVLPACLCLSLSYFCLRGCQGRKRPYLLSQASCRS